MHFNTLMDVYTLIIVNNYIICTIFISVILITTLIHFFLKKNYLYKLDILKQSYYCIFIWFFAFVIFIILIWLFGIYFNNIKIANNTIKYFLLGYCIEQLLSLDNIIMWFIIFKYFNVSTLLQKKVLNYGIYVAFSLRMFLIVLNYWCFLHWHWIIFVFGVILLFSGLEMLCCNQDDDNDIKKNLFFICIKRFFRVTNNFNKDKFFIWKNGLLYVTYLFITLLMIEISDIIFAIDSIPVIFSFIDNPIIIFISNIFSILVLREIYFVISNLLYKNIYLKSFISFLIICISIKIMLENYLYVLHSIFLSFLIILLILFFIYKLFLKKLFK